MIEYLSVAFADKLFKIFLSFNIVIYNNDFIQNIITINLFRYVIINRQNNDLKMI